MTRRHKQCDVWAFWQQSTAAVRELEDLMQQIATVVSQETPAIPIPRTLEINARHAIHRFERDFSSLVREQTRKAAIR